jgi:hypothetical protein
MKTLWRWQLTVALILAGITVFVGSATASTLKESLTLTIHIYNYAEVAPQTLIEAERVATGIFEKSGVQIRWTEVDAARRSKQANSEDHVSFPLSHIQLSVVTGEMFGRLGLSDDAMGMTPGTGPDRQHVYVSASKVEELLETELGAQRNGIMGQGATKPQILGHAIAHEMGHLLLNLTTHSAFGIMRGAWDFKDLNDAAVGRFLFSAEQGKILRAEVLRRTAQQ